MDSHPILTILYSAITFIISSVVIILFFFLYVAYKTNRENILFLFLEIPQNNLHILHKKCEKFIANQQQKKNLYENDLVEDEESIFDEDDENNEEDCIGIMQDTVETEEKDEEYETAEALKQASNRRKIIKNYHATKYKGQLLFIIELILIGITGSTYAIINLAGIYLLSIRINFLIPQYFIDGQLVSKYLELNSIHRLYLSGSDLIINEKSIYEYEAQLLGEYLRKPTKYEDHQSEVVELDESIKDEYLQLQFGDCCGFLEENQQIEQCESILNSNLRIGLNNIQQLQFNLISTQLEEMEQNSTIDFTRESLTAISELGLIILQFEHYLFFIDNVIQELIDPIINLFILHEKAYLISKIDSQKQFQNVSFYIFIVVLIIFYLIWWLPLLSQMKNQITRTVGMLNMLPLKVIKENANIRKFIRMLIRNKYIK